MRPELVEVKLREQGRPSGRVSIELATGGAPVVGLHILLKEELDRVEKLLDRLLNEQIGQLDRLIDIAEKSMLHLASLSDAEVDEANLEEE